MGLFSFLFSLEWKSVVIFICLSCISDVSTCSNCMYRTLSITSSFSNGIIPSASLKNLEDVSLVLCSDAVAHFIIKIDILCDFGYTRILSAIDYQHLNPWSPGGTLMVQKMGITPPIPVFEGLSTLHVFFFFSHPADYRYSTMALRG